MFKTGQRYDDEFRKDAVKLSYATAKPIKACFAKNLK
jgi:hypothetical protein